LSRSEEQAKSLYLSRLEKDALRIQFQMDMLKKYGQFLVQHHFVVGFLELLQRTQNTNKNNIEDSILFRQLNSLFTKLVLDNDFSAVYLLDIYGNCIASSNKSFLGKNYSFRPYFKQALQKGSFIYPALGVTSKKMGIYYAYLVKRGSKKLGVCVIKIRPMYFKLTSGPLVRNVDPEILNLRFTGLATGDGVIFTGTMGQGLYSFAPLSETIKQKLICTRQFPPDQIKPLGRGVDWDKLLKKSVIRQNAYMFGHDCYLLLWLNLWVGH